MKTEFREKNAVFIISQYSSLSWCHKYYIFEDSENSVWAVSLQNSKEEIVTNNVYVVFRLGN